MPAPTEAEVAAAFRSPLTPELFTHLGDTPAYLAHVWPVLARSLDTDGFLGSALYLADMALDAVEAVYEPVLTRDAFAETMAESDLRAVEAVLGVFHYLLPQVLLAGAALAEAFERPEVGGEGRVEPRVLRERERSHLDTVVPTEVADTSMLAGVVDALQVTDAPQLYRVLAHWPGYLEGSWDELQHLATYPDFRRRGRGLYYYARAGARFLAAPLQADASALSAAGLSDEEIEAARAIVDGSVPALATMVMHCTAMRVALGHTGREVVGV